MSMHGGGRYSFLTSTDERPKVTWALIQRVLRYGVPYRFHIAGMLLLILLHSGLALVSPLILRDLIDRTLPNKDLNRLGLLSLALLALVVALLPLGWIWLRSRGHDTSARIAALTTLTAFLTFDLVVGGFVVYMWAVGAVVGG
mgnify:CR=1 FL=1